MSQQGGSPTGHEDDWWRQLYEDSTDDTGPTAAPDSLDDRFASAAGAVGEGSTSPSAVEDGHTAPTPGAGPPQGQPTSGSRVPPPRAEATPTEGTGRHRAPWEPPPTAPASFPPGPMPPGFTDEPPSTTGAPRTSTETPATTTPTSPTPDAGPPPTPNGTESDPPPPTPPDPATEPARPTPRHGTEAPSKPPPTRPAAELPSTPPPTHLDAEAPSAPPSTGPAAEAPAAPPPTHLDAEAPSAPPSTHPAAEPPSTPPPTHLDAEAPSVPPSTRPAAEAPSVPAPTRPAAEPPSVPPPTRPGAEAPSVPPPTHPATEPPSAPHPVAPPSEPPAASSPALPTTPAPTATRIDIPTAPPPHLDYVGSGPPTYDAEPTALPPADPDDLDDLVADTVLDGAQYGTCSLRAVSVRGDSARYRGEPRRDSLLTARFGSGEEALILVAMATGARATPGAHRAAAEACHWIGRAVGRSHARLSEDIRAARRGDLKSGLHRLTDRSLGKLRASAAEQGIDPEEYAATLRCLLLPADPECRTRVFFGVGAGGLFRLRGGEWHDIEPSVGDITGEPVVGFGSLPHETPDGDRLTMDLGIPTPPSPYEPAPEPPREPFRFRASVARPGDTLLMCTSGLAEPLRGESELCKYLTGRWSGPTPPGLAAFLADTQTRVKGYADDRTAAAVWEA
ncbi:protein phosphatase 2C domain-containing protein [Streptomyces sp. NBC_00444]|uniref:PP2C family serine/threonine-protein phosphatase n=1 Tax=Streptomyces sp. NBC_00444 TaxID=2975744 RepID=UPI002E209A6E